MANTRIDPVASILESHLASQLQSYQGNLLFALSIVQNHALPAPEDPGIQQHLETLRRCLAEEGHPVDDTFLLRLGLTVPGRQRGIVPPLMVLDENRGGFSVRRQREAAGQVVRLHEALQIGRRFVPLLPEDTERALTELARLPLSAAEHRDEDLVQTIAALSLEQAEKLAKIAFSLLDDDETSAQELGTQLLQQLACFRATGLSEAQCGELLDRSVTWPASLYRDAGESLARRLVARLKKKTKSRNHELLCLAWTRSDAAREAYHRWVKRPPSWAAQLHVSPPDYLHDAGWCLEASGERRDLISLRCFRLVQDERADEKSIACRTTTNEACTSCAGPLSWLFDLRDLDSEYFAGELVDAPRQVLCCLHCACFSPVYSNYRGDTPGVRASGAKVQRAQGTDARRVCYRRLVETPHPPFANAEPFSTADASTLGGIPMWLQDAEYPGCLDCGQRMSFFAQHDNSPLGEEGIYYAFFCASCHISAVSYQQT